MDFSFSSILAGLVFGSFGLYFIKRAKSEARIPMAFVGLALLAFPYFIENAYLLWAIGIGLMVFGFKIA